MHEPILAWFAFLGATIGTWFYRRYLEHEIAPDEAFERWCSEGPTLVALRCEDASREALERALQPLLTGLWVNLHGGRPWPQYKLRLGLVWRGSVLLLQIRATRRLKVAEVPRSLLGVLSDALRGVGCEVWVNPAAIHELSGPPEKRPGWTLTEEANAAGLAPLREAPSWLVAAGGGIG